GEVVAVDELEARLQLHREIGRRGEISGLGDVRLDVGAAGRRVHQERVDLVHHGERPVVVRAGGVQGGDLVAGADGEGATTAAAGRPAVVVAAAARGQHQSRGRNARR